MALETSRSFCPEHTSLASCLCVACCEFQPVGSFFRRFHLDVDSEWLGSHSKCFLPFQVVVLFSAHCYHQFRALFLACQTHVMFWKQHSPIVHAFRPFKFQMYYVPRVQMC